MWNFCKDTVVHMGTDPRWDPVQGSIVPGIPDGLYPGCSRIPDGIVPGIPGGIPAGIPFQNPRWYPECGPIRDPTWDPA